MKHGKHETPKRARSSRSVKLTALILSLVLVIGGVVGGTLAWLVDQTDEVVNTFTYGDVNISLEETNTNLDGDDDPNTNDYEMIPGENIEKDPKVTVKAGSEPVWLFVKIEESENFDDFMEYLPALGWAPLLSEPGVYFRVVDSSEEDQEFPVLLNDTVHVKGSVTKEMLNALDADGAENYPTLTVTAYAIQYSGFEVPGNPDFYPVYQLSAARAWAAVEAADPAALTEEEAETLLTAAEVIAAADAYFAAQAE